MRTEKSTIPVQTERLLVELSFFISKMFNRIVGSVKPTPKRERKYSKEAKEDEMMSTSAAFWHCMTLVLGLGTLTMPYALKGLGWAGLIVLAFLAWLSCHTAKLLCLCIDYSPPVDLGRDKLVRLNTYADIGQAAYGHKCRQIVNWVLNVDLVASSALFLVFIATNLMAMFPWIRLNRSQWIILTTMTLFPTMHLKLNKLSFLSKLGSFIMLFLVFGVLYSTVMAKREDLVDNEYHLAKFEMQAIGNMVFAFACHGTLLTIYRQMKTPNEVGKLFNQVYATGYMLKFLVGATGYYLFAQNVSDQISLNLPFQWLKMGVTAFVTMKKWLTYALPLEPVAIAAEAEYSDKSSFVIRSGLVFLTMVLALGLPYFGLFQSLVGSLCAGLLVLIFPLMFYIKLFGQAMSKVAFYSHVVLLVFSAWLVFMATAHSLMEAQRLFSSSESMNSS